MKKFLEGPYAVLMTPFDGNRFHEKNYIDQIRYVNGSGVSGFVVNGSTAEFVQLSLEEQMRAADLVAQYRDPKKEFIVSACTGNAADTLRLARHVAEIGAKAVLVCPPYYFTFTPAEREAYYRTVADASPVPVILYNIPFFTQELELSVIYRLFEHPNIRGIKDSSANMKRLIHMVDMTRDTDTAILTGTDDILMPALYAGCAGSMTAMAAICPKEISALYQAHYAGDTDTVRKIQHDLLPVTRKADSQTFPFGYKRLMEEVSGIPMGDKEDKMER